MTIDWNQCRDTSFGVATEKGWWQQLRSIANVTILMNSEVSETVDDYRNHRELDEYYFEYVGSDLSKKGSQITLEAFEAMDHLAVAEWKPCGIPAEIADAAIRICDYAGHKQYNLDPPVVDLSDESGENLPFEDCLAHIHWAISKAYAVGSDSSNYLADSEDREEGLIGDVGCEYYLSLALAYIEVTCDCHGISLEKAIRIKEAFNKTRPIRHGGKKI